MFQPLELVPNREHSVIFSGNGEKIVIKHISTSRDIFANGAIEAAK